MKPKLYALLLIGLFCLALLTGCLRLRSGFGNPAGQAAAIATLASTPAAPAAVEPTQTQPAVPDSTAQPGITVPAAVTAPDVSKAADDLSNSLDDLMKDLNSTDDLNDVK
jgi:hypothetical protein